MTGSAPASRPEAPEPHWLTALRADGRVRFEALGLPTPRLEAWRHFPLRALRGVDLGASAPAATPPTDLADTIAALRLPGTSACAVFVDGRFAPGLSDLAALPPGARVGGLAAALAATPDALASALGRVAPGADAALVAANAAWFRDGLHIDLPAGAGLGGPLQALFLATAAAPPAAQLRNLVTLGRAAELQLVLRWAGPDGAPYAINAVTELDLAPGANLHLVSVEGEGDAALHVHHVQAALAADATLRAFTLATGGRSARTSVRAELRAAGASAQVDGLYLAAGEQRLDHYTEVDHLAPHTTSDTSYAGLVDGDSVGSYQGVAFIRAGASKAQAAQLHKSLLLSPSAQAHSKPQLEIDHDDVKASHGSTVGQLSAASLFYLVSRGLTPEAARGLLTLAFAKDALSRLGDGPLARALAAHVAAELGADPAAAGIDPALDAFGDDDTDPAEALA